MRLQNKIALIGLLASTALIGTGFAAWTFKNSVEQKTKSQVTPLIVCAVELNDDFELYNADDDSAPLSSLYLICDAPSEGLTTTLGGHGVYWSSTNDETAYANKIDKVYIKGSLKYIEYDIQEETSFTVTFTTGTNYSLTNGNYVEFAAATLPDDVVVTVIDGTEEVQSGEFALPVPTYNSSVSAENFKNVEDVAKITNGLSNLVISYKATITE